VLVAACTVQWTAADQQLLDGLKAENASQVHAALSQGAKPNTEYADGMRPLGVAVARNDHASAEALLKAGADPNIVVDLSAAGGTDVGSRKASLLSLAEDREMAGLLVKGGADPNRKGAAAETPLGRAVTNGDAEAVKALLDVGASVESPLADGQSPLRFAASTNNVAVITVLLAGGADPNREDSEGRTPLHEAAANPNAGAVTALLAGKASIDDRSHDGTTPLMVAAAEGYVGPVRVLLENGADPNVKNEAGMTAIDLANAKGQSQIATLLAEGGGKATRGVDEARAQMRSAAGSDALRIFTTDLTTDGRNIKIRGRVENPYSETVHGIRYRVALLQRDSKRVLDTFLEERDDTEIAPGGSVVLRLDIASMYAATEGNFAVEAVPMRLGNREIPAPPQWK
jgi:ankyrin repeat protein